MSDSRFQISYKFFSLYKKKYFGNISARLYLLGVKNFPSHELLNNFFVFSLGVPNPAAGGGGWHVQRDGAPRGHGDPVCGAGAAQGVTLAGHDRVRGGSSTRRHGCPFTPLRDQRRRNEGKHQRQQVIYN